MNREHLIKHLETYIVNLKLEVMTVDDVLENIKIIDEMRKR
uniref:Uncharacterized protein n=1 Tax=viral metagenome TaxID=1070528 RepID=A0A6M3LTK2_9ZZZZ